MIEPDTIKLLRECDAGVHMAIDAIDEVIEDVRSAEMRSQLIESKDKHSTLAGEIECLLHSYGDEGKELSPVAKSMAWIKTNFKLALDDSDKTIADLITDGCGMGVKSLTRYLNQYPAAEESAKDITRKLISLEQMLEADMHPYL